MTATPRRTVLGEKGPAVKAWQQLLLSEGYDIGAADGIHGQKTEQASLHYESKRASALKAEPITYTRDQKRAIDAVLSIFETGRVPSPSSYSTIAILKDGAGISYGKHQATDRAGSLDLVCKRYIELRGKRADELSAYMAMLKSNESVKHVPGSPMPAWLKNLVVLLRELGSESTMQAAQDEVFDRVYFEPAVKHCNELGLRHALSLLVIYDTCIHSGPLRVQSHAAAIQPKSPMDGGDEHSWVAAYLAERREWLSRSANQLVRKTIYRPDALSKLIASKNWSLAMPFTCLGKTIT